MGDMNAKAGKDNTGRRTSHRNSSFYKRQDYKGLIKIRNEKSPGPDHIPHEVLNINPELTYVILTCLKSSGKRRRHLGNGV